MRPDLKQGRSVARAFEGAVRATLRERRLAGPDDALLVALSGGPDSTCLLAVLRALHGTGVVGRLVACHVDHRLRPGGAEDAAFCQALCARLGTPLRSVAVAVGGGNLQAAARRARYAALRAIAAEVGARRIATGHTRSDQAETVLFRLVRGAGARGLAGIPPRRGTIIRPLLDRSRAEVLAYLAARGLPYREDPTNASPRFDRSRIRHEVLPLLAALRPGAEAALARAADLLRQDERALDALARAVAPPGSSSAGVDRLAAAPGAVRARALRRLWREATGSRRGLAAHHVEAVVRLLGRGRPGRVSLPGGRIAVVEGGLVRIDPAPSGPVSRASRRR
jgi:tRNA(Ile)-lysidine synthase